MGTVGDGGGYSCAGAGGVREIPLPSCQFAVNLKVLFFPFSKERGREGEGEGKKHICVREISIGCLWHTAGPGMEPTTQAWALTWHGTSHFAGRCPAN